VTWIPVDVVAASLLEMCHVDEPVFHLISPRQTPWDDIMGAFSNRLKLPLIPLEEWNARLRKMAANESQDTSVLALQSYFERGRFGDVNVSTERATTASSTLANKQPLGEADVELYLSYWRKVGFLKY
jgi:hypothetical protein